MEISNSVVIGIGMGTVFVSLICLIVICYITSFIVSKFQKNEKKEEQKPVAPQANAPVSVSDKGEFAAAVAVAIAEDLGTDVTGIRIKSIKKL